MEPLPSYVEDQVPQSPFNALLTRISASVSTSPYTETRAILESFVDSQKAPGYHTDNAGPIDSPKPINAYPNYTGRFDTEGILTRVKQEIVNELFNAIRREDNESIRLLIQQNLVSANTTDNKGSTPLLAAVAANIMSVVKELLELGADPNVFGVVENETRTPLMLAAHLGSLPMVKLLFEPPYSANDALVAPDSQIALRLAARANHPAVVAYLPSRRAGGFLRFKTAHAANVAQIKKAIRKIGSFVKIFVWDIPKFLLWSVPKHVVVLPVVKTCKWCWANKQKLGPWCKHQLTEIPKRIGRAGKAIWRGLKKVPNTLKKTGEETWKFCTQTLPRCAKEFVVWLWKLFTVRIPNAILITLKWIWSGVCSCAKAIWGILVKLVSFMHSILLAAITFLCSITLRDIWNALSDVLRAIFVTLPTALGSWIARFGEASYKAMKALLGLTGQVLWWIVTGLVWLAVYIPRKLWTILKSLGNSVSKAFHEIVVLINPKA